MSNITLGERITSVVLGSLFGALIGLILTWLFGVFSQTLGVGKVQTDFDQWLGLSALVFALLGFIFGRRLGTFVGHVLNALFQFEDQRNYEYLNRLLLIVFALFIIGAWIVVKL